MTTGTDVGLCRTFTGFVISLHEINLIRLIRKVFPKIECLRPTERAFGFDSVEVMV